MGTGPNAGGAPVRRPLNRRRVLDGALEMVDEYGLDALSMHKLGARLGVRGMSLYNHVQGKDGLLDGMVEAMWSEVDTDIAGSGDWRAAVRTLARSLRDLVHRHPGAAPLLMTRRVMPAAALQISAAHLSVMRDAGVPTECAAALLRTVLSYSVGNALAEISYGSHQTATQPAETERERRRRVDLLIPEDTPHDLARVAYLLCGEFDAERQFAIGIDLMIDGLDAALARPNADDDKEALSLGT